MSQTGDPGNQTMELPRGEGPGGRIGPYKILQQIGEGGFGAVFEAEQEEPVRRRVALKVIKLGMDTREVIARFEAERQALAIMDHPHIARVLDAGATDSGRPYFVMELVKGEPLSSYCRKHDLSILERLQLFDQVCAAVQHAHTKGVIHRDLKPTNVLVSTQDEAPFAKVIDFGIAKAISGRLTDRTLFTEQNLMMGTPLYMSPEQAEGSFDIDARTDVYSLGAILYELLTDTTPIESDTLRNAACAEVQRIIREVDPPPPSDRLSMSATTQPGAITRRGMDPRKLARTVRGELDWIVMKALEKDRSRRYESANGLAMDLRRYQAHEPVQAAPPSVSYRLQKFIRRNKGALAAGSVVVLLLLVAYFGFDKFVLEPRREAAQIAAATKSAALQATPATNDKSIAVLPFENLSADKENAYFASGMRDMILTKLSAIGTLKVISRTSTEKYASHPDDLKAVALQLGVATILEGSVQKSGNQVLINAQLIDARTDNHLWAEAYPRSLDNVFGVEGEVAQSVADALKAKLTPAQTVIVSTVPTHDREAYDLYLRANAYFNRANDQEALAVKDVPQAIDLYQKALEKDPGFALDAAALSRARIYLYWKEADKSEAQLAAAKAAAEQALALQPDLGEGHMALGLYHYWGHRDYVQALQQFELARRTMPNNAELEGYFAYIARRQGRWSDAIAGMQRAALLDPRSSEFLDGLALTYSDLRRYEEADSTYARAESVTQNPAEERITRAANVVRWKGDLAPARAALGALKVGSDDYTANAQNFFELDWLSRDYAAAAIVAENASDADWNGPRRLSLAQAYQAAGDKAKARPLYMEVRTQMQAALRQRPDDADLHMDLSYAAAGLGLKDEAISEGRKATTLMSVGLDAGSGPSYLEQLTELYVRVGEYDQAINLLQKLLAMPTSGSAISPALLKLDPIWDPLRKDPRFQKLIADSKAH